MKVVSNKRNGTGHFAVDASSIDTDTSVVVLNSLFSQDPDILSLAASSHAMHNDNNGLISTLRLFPQPIKRNVPSIGKENPFPLEGDVNLRGVELIDGLEMVSEKVRRGGIGRGLWGESKGED